MHHHGSWRARAIALAAIASSAALLVACQDATSIELQISTDLPCDDVRVVTTSISSGSLATYETRPPSAVTTRCDEATGHIGSLVLVPSDDDSAEVAVRVVTARSSRLPEQCLASAGPECIIARRVVRFSPHRMLTLPIRMQNVCAGVTCAAGETCTDGRCVSAVVTPEAFQTADDDASAPVRDAGAPRSTPPDDGGSASTSPPPPPPPPPSAGPDAGGPHDDDKGKGKPGKKNGGAETGGPFSDAGVTPASPEPAAAHDAGASSPPTSQPADAGAGGDDDEKEGEGGREKDKAPRNPKKPKNPK